MITRFNAKCPGCHGPQEYTIEDRINSSNPCVMIEIKEVGDHEIERIEIEEGSLDKVINALIMAKNNKKL